MGITVNPYLASLCWFGIGILIRILIYYSPISFSWNLLLKRILTGIVFLLCCVMICQAFLIPTSKKEVKKINIDFVKEVLPNAHPRAIPINTPIPGKKTNLTVQVVNDGPWGGSLVFLKNGKQIFKPYLAPGGGQSGTKTFFDEDGKTVYSYIPPQLQQPTSFIVNGTFEIIDKQEGQK